MYDEQYEQLTDNQIQDKIIQLSKQYQYYRYRENDQVIQSISLMLETLYRIKDDRAYTEFYKKYYGEDGVFIDASTHGQKKKEEKKTYGRKPVGGSHL